MKNRIFILIVILSSIFLIDNVNAQTYNLIFDYNNSNLDLLKENLSIVDEIRKLSDEYNTNNYTYYVSYHKTGGSYYLGFGVGTYSCSSAYYSISYSTSYKSLYNGVFSYLNGNDNFCEDFVQTGSKILVDYITLNLSNLSDESKQTFLNNVKDFFINGTNKYGSMQEQTYQSKPNLDVFTNNNFSVPVYSNVDLKFVKAYNDAYSYDKSIQVDDNVYNYNEIIPTYYDYFGLSKPKNYKFDDIIHDDNIARTYFYLDIEELRKNNFNVDIKYAFGNYTDNILSPYLEIKYKNDTTSYISLDNNENSIVNVYMGNYSMCLDDGDNITSVKVVFPMENTKNIDYKVQLESNVSIEIFYELDDLYDDEHITIDLTNKYALLVIPKVKNANEIFEDFYLNGDFEIRHISNIDDIDNSGFSYGKKVNDYYRYITDFRYETVAIEFVNNFYKTGDSVSITFKEDLFSYYIIEKDYSIIDITNPNNGNNTSFDSNTMNNNFNEKATNQSYTDLYGTLGKFISENEDAKTLLKMSLKKFFDTCPRDVQRLLMIIILFSVAACTFAVAGWR